MSAAKLKYVLYDSTYQKVKERKKQFHKVLVFHWEIFVINIHESGTWAQKIEITHKKHAGGEELSQKHMIF